MKSCSRPHCLLSRLAEVAKKKAAVEDAYWADEGDKNSKKKQVQMHKQKRLVAEIQPA